MSEILEAVEQQKNAIADLIKSGDPLTIQIIDEVCAFQFKKYAVSGDAEWSDDNHYSVTFADSSAVPVSLADFVRYQMHYSQLALEIENEFGAADDLRDAQNDAIEKLICEFAGE